jgi:ABC-type transport system substrate-binding protein
MFAIMMILPPLFASGQYAGGELVLRVAMQDDMKGTNPLTVSDVWSGTVLQWIYDRPTQIDYDSQEIMPYIAVGSANLSGKAESWGDCAIGNFGYSPASIWENASKREAIIFYDFTNVTWHDGTPMAIRDVLFSFHLAGQVPEWSYSVNPLKDNGGRSGTNYTETGWLHIHKVWEDGNRAALRFQLQEPRADFFKTVASPMLLPYHIWGSTISGQALDGAKIWCDPGYNSTAADSWKVNLAQSYDNNPPIGSCIFKFNRWDKGQFTRVDTYRDHFYGPDYAYRQYIEANYPDESVKQPTIDAITFKIYKTAEAAVMALKCDDIDYIAWSIPPSFVQELAREPGIALYNSPDPGFFYLAYNMRNPSFGYNQSKSFPYAPEDDLGKPLRRAMAHCIDRNTIITRLLLNLGIAGAGPVNPMSEWHNHSVPRYAFNPPLAKQILADAGYGVRIGNSSALVYGQAAMDAAGPNNWWVNPNGTNIGSGVGGKIEILTPEANYDPIRHQAGLMFAKQFRDIGIHAESVAWDFGIIVDRMVQRTFDMYILGWLLGSDPTDYLWAFYHSSNAAYGQNYAGYRNATFDAIIDRARMTGDLEMRKQLVFDAQAAICYDLPNDILYYRTNILLARTDRFTGWIERDGGIFHRASIVNLRGPYLYSLAARFENPISAVYSNSSTPLSVMVTGDGGIPLEGVVVKLNASIGNLAPDTGNTDAGGRIATTFTAPYVPPTPDNIRNGTLAYLQITSATWYDRDYSPAPPRFILVIVYPEDAKFMSVSIAADPDVIDDVGSDLETPGFTYVDVEVRDQDGNPVVGALVNLTCVPDTATIPSNEARTDPDGKVRFTVTAPQLWNDDGSVVHLVLNALAVHPEDPAMVSENFVFLSVLDVWQAYDHYEPPPPYPMICLPLFIAGIIILAVITHIVTESVSALRRKRK